jgi:hypothetical protein
VQVSETLNDAITGREEWRLEGARAMVVSSGGNGQCGSIAVDV